MRTLYCRIVPGIFITCVLVLSSCSSTAPRVQNSVVVQESVNGRFIPGDGLRITLPLDSLSFLNGVYPIDDSGNVMLPLVGRYNVANVAPFEFSSFLKQTFEQYIHYPEVQVQPLIRVSLLGGFNHSGMYYVEPERSVWDLISMAGGTTHERGLKKMRWERNRKVVSEDLISILQSGKSLRMIGFQSGDQIWTPTDNRTFRETFVQEVLPFATFGLSVFLGIMTIKNND